MLNCTLKYAPRSSSSSTPRFVARKDKMSSRVWKEIKAQITSLGSFAKSTCPQCLKWAHVHWYDEPILQVTTALEQLISRLACTSCQAARNSVLELSSPARSLPSTCDASLSSSEICTCRIHKTLNPGLRHGMASSTQAHCKQKFQDTRHKGRNLQCAPKADKISGPRPGVKAEQRSGPTVYIAFRGSILWPHTNQTLGRKQLKRRINSLGKAL